MGVKAVVQRKGTAVWGKGGKGHVGLAPAEHVQDHLRRAVENFQADVREGFVEGLQAGQQVGPGHCIVGADDQLAQKQIPTQRQFLLPMLQKPHRLADIVIEHGSLSGQLDPSGAAGKQPHLKLRLQLLDRLTDGGLGQI